MRKVFLSMICAACAITASAQRASSSTFFSTEKVDNPLTIGIRAGGNLSTFTGDYAEDWKSRFGFNVGVNFDYSIMKCFGIQTGVYFTTKGAKEEMESVNRDYISSKTNKLNPMYIQIPVLASFRYNINNDLRWEFNAGPYFAFGVGGKVKSERTYTSIYDDGAVTRHEETEEDFFNDDTNSFDMGIALGTGLTYKKFYFGVQYEIGMTNMLKDTSDDIKDMKNSNFTFNIGYNF